MSPLFVTSARASIAALLGATFYLSRRLVLPLRTDVVSLALVSVGVVVGFPLLSAMALQHISASRSLVFTGMLSLATVVFAIMRGEARPRPAYWLFAVSGAAAVGTFALSHSSRDSALGDVEMLGAILLCGLGYAEGARLSRRLGSTSVIIAALVLALPVTLPLCLLTMPPHLLSMPVTALGGLAYVSVISMLVAFLFWYRGLALGGVTGVGQLQLLQPLMGIVLAALLLGDTVSWDLLVTAVVVVVCVAGARKYT